MNVSSALRLARQLLDEHGLTDWRVELDRAKTRAGQCRYGDRTITLSRHLTALHDEAEVRDTILHEVAHALVGPNHGHDAVWRRAAARIGGSAQRQVSPESARVPGRWVGRCPNGHEVTRHRAPRGVLLCGACRGRLPRERVLSWTHDGAPVPLSAAYRRQLDAVMAGPARLPRDPQVTVGERVRVVAQGRYGGIEGVVVKRARTRYHVAVDGGVLTVPFQLVERVHR